MKTQTVTIRRAGEQDLATLAQFNSAMAAESEDKTLDTATVRGGIEYLLSHSDEGFYLVAQVNQAVAGALMVTYEWSDWRNGRFWWIQSVFVRPEHRRQGVYRALHNQVLQLARQDTQACGVRLYVERENTGAQTTYASLGMEQTGYLLYEEEF